MKTHDIESLRDKFLEEKSLKWILENGNVDSLVFRVDKAFDQISQAVTGKFQIGEEAILKLKPDIALPV